MNPCDQLMVIYCIHPLTTLLTKYVKIKIIPTVGAQRHETSNVCFYFFYVLNIGFRTEVVEEDLGRLWKGL